MEKISSRTPIVKFMEIWPPFKSLREKERKKFAKYGRVLESGGFDCPLAVVSWDNSKEFRKEMLQTVPEEDAEMLFNAFWECVNSDDKQAKWHWSGFRDFPWSMAARRLLPWEKRAGIDNS